MTDTGGKTKVVWYLTALHGLLLLTPSRATSSEREFYKPPSACLTGPSCHNCIDTLEFRSLRVCCYNCRLDNVVMNDHICHCIDTRLPGSPQGLGGNCSSGQVCDNCAVKISADVSEGPSDTPGTTSYCCQDCGIATPYIVKDAEQCHCAADTQGRQHEIVPRYDPPTVTPDSRSEINAAGLVMQFNSSCLQTLALAFCILHVWHFISVVSV